MKQGNYRELIKDLIKTYLFSEHELIYLSCLLERIKRCTACGILYEHSFLIACACLLNAYLSFTELDLFTKPCLSMELMKIRQEYPTLLAELRQIRPKEINAMYIKFYGLEQKKQKGGDDLNEIVDQIFQRDIPYKIKLHNLSDKCNKSPEITESMPCTKSASSVPGQFALPPINSSIGFKAETKATTLGRPGSAFKPFIKGKI